ncbi:MAG: hypothetical protein ABWY45_11435 [Mycobacterium sp.]
MPAEDLLRFIGEPPEVSRWWLALGVLGILAVIGWCAGVFVWTMPTAPLRGMPVIGTLRAEVTRRRFARSVRRIGDRFRSGALTPAQACAELSGVVRSFLSVATGTPAEYMHVSELANSAVADASPLLAELTAAQFDHTASPDVATLERAAEELISTWN